MFSTTFIAAAVAMSSVLQPSAGLVFRRTVNCDNILDWKPNTQYTAGNQTVFTNELWTATQWSYNNPPYDAANEWSLDGSCSVPRPPVKVSCQGIAAWNKQTQYDGGSKVTYNGDLWYAPNWVSSNVPGDKSGSWVEEGVCTN
ncbi:carbohydrate-binding module family 5 protein [Hygrophoropsis aurantiaca]|uniref:Carbohydrate-binding module family 5 protein n=1 Tax=Hygrophoropsis aurantiaca TaxID=72124 RepID=A0ACB7ZTA4_9AGAM|nr:carbohydrate-binding module family 5 protein [Hygrophoropsis aurantiaca]